MKKLIKMLLIMIVLEIVTIIVPVISNAAGLTVNVSNNSPEAGSTISLTIGSGIGGKVSISSSNPSVISVPSSTFIDYNSTTLSLNAKSAGSATITVTAVDVVTTDAEPKEVTGSKSITINVKAKEASKPEAKPETPAKPQQSKPKPNNTQTTQNKPQTTQTEPQTQPTSQPENNSNNQVEDSQKNNEVESSIAINNSVVNEITNTSEENFVEQLKDNDNKRRLVFTIPQFTVIILSICLAEGVLLKLPWKKQ